jgi:hypothetical protein
MARTLDIQRKSHPLQSTTPANKSSGKKKHGKRREEKRK